MKNVIRFIVAIITIGLIIAIIYSFSTKAYNEKEKLVEKDEAEYGNEYMELKCEAYKQKPDRIVIKKQNTKNEFYIFDKQHLEYEHLLKVALDKMYYIYNSDPNKWAFTPYLIDDISSSDENFIIFDYDGEFNINDFESNRDIFFRFKENTGLYRLIDLVTYKSQKNNIEKLRDAIGKNEFTPKDLITSGYKYMTMNIFMD